MNYYYRMNIALIVFAGSGSRMQNEVPKQFIKINDIDLVVYTIKKFNDNPNIDEIDLVTSEPYLPYVQEYKDKYQLNKINKIIKGGETRQESVRLGLEALDADEDDNVLIHDGDRPLVSNAIINQCVDFLSEFNAVTPYLDQKDRHPELSNSGRAIVLEGKNVDIQTPQGFKYGLIKSAHIENKDNVFSDDISLVENDVEVHYFEGDKDNFKVTKKQDLEFLEKLLEERQ